MFFYGNIHHLFVEKARYVIFHFWKFKFSRFPLIIRLGESLVIRVPVVPDAFGQGDLSAR